MRSRAKRSRGRMWEQDRESISSNPTFYPSSTSQNVHFSILWANPVSLPARWGNKLLLIPTTEAVLTNPLSNWVDDRACSGVGNRKGRSTLFWRKSEHHESVSSGKGWELFWMSGSITWHWCLTWSLSTQGWWLVPEVIAYNHSPSWGFKLRLYF